MQPHAYTHVLSYMNILHLHLHICTHSQMFTCTHKCAYASMQALNDVQGIDTGVGAREKAGSGKGLVILGSKSGLLVSPPIASDQNSACIL